MLKQLRILFLVLIIQCLGFSPWALAHQAKGQNIEFKSCPRQICFSLVTDSILTSQFTPVWSLSAGKLILPEQQIDFISGFWDQISDLYILKTKDKEYYFDSATGSLKVETGL